MPTCAPAALLRTSRLGRWTRSGNLWVMPQQTAELRSLMDAGNPLYHARPRTSPIWTWPLHDLPGSQPMLRTTGLPWDLRKSRRAVLRL